ncbi:uncharacterized protein LOC131251735 [Magnolia sinica]|uniref:uncharacterized protein LOC131251735 n=1 Tax=Magnolia sinica TaxID=86752 RepID=UPI00265A8C74|nr:uncharacterized protein LOC131251735 [Magnolia sinica]XP_058108634.1 uncharacterized protein LOC131251735 [Magnolia sinica]
MSATVLSDPTAITAQDSQSQSIKTEVEFAKCDCCGLTEECTLAYIARVRERYHGRWICGLCSEAVKDEIFRSDRIIGTEEALIRHINFCKKFSPSPPLNPTEHLIAAMRQLLRRSLDSPRALRSTPSSPRRKDGEEDVRTARLGRSGSCFSTLAS